MHKSKRRRIGISLQNSMIGKMAVMGLLERHPDGRSKVRTLVTKSRKKQDFQSQVRTHVEAGATVNTNAHFSYQGLARDYAHNVIDHAEKYVDGHVHTNGCEDYWSLLRRTLNRTYVSVEPFHLFRYLDEQAFRFNHRKDINDADRFSEAIYGIVGRRLMYRGLIASTDAPNVP